MASREVVGRKSPTCRMIRRKMLTVLAMLVLSACSKQPPPIGRDLPITFGYTPAFEQRLSQRFPVGSEEQQLVTELRNEVFGIACKDEWTVQWSADQGKITGITGLNRRVCL